jgi:hypothetical protein
VTRTVRDAFAAVRRVDVAAVLALPLVYGTVAQGGFYPVQAMTLAAATLVCAVLFGGRIPRPVVFGFAALALGIGLSWALRPEGDPRVATAVLVIAIGATVIGARVRASWSTVCGLLLLIGAGASLIGIAATVAHREPYALEAQGIWRAASTLTYANSLGAVLVPCFAAAAIRLAARSTFLERLGTAAIVAGSIASLSRAAWVSVVLG